MAAGTQQGTEQTQGQQAAGTEDQGTGAQPLGLLDEQAAQSGTDGQGQEQAGGTGDGTGQTPPVPATPEQIADLINREVDRRMTSLYREVRGQAGQQGQQQGQGQGQQGEQQGGPQSGQQQTPAGPSEADVREARLVYREYVGDEIKFLGTVEREHASTVAQALLRERIGRGDDPDRAGREVAREVASTVKALRQHYEQQTVAALKRRGLLPDDGRGPGQQPVPGTAAPGAQSGFAAGQAKAAALFAERMPVATG